MEQSINPEYHAVYLSQDDLLSAKNENRIIDKQKLHVYTKKSEALQIIKQYKKGRLKTFKRWEDAAKFAQKGGEFFLTNSIPTIITEEKSNFKALRPQELTQFRKIIEAGDIESVTRNVWKNPRYLVSAGDTPAILQEGCRYNALHVAVKVTKSPKMCSFILNTITSTKFLELIYGADSSKTYVDRGSILQDLYLNTPDKGLNETPLHFATKFGLKEVVKTLVSYPKCLRNTLNKYNQTPADIICTRKEIDDRKLANEIRLLLEDQYFIPVLRSEDMTLQPRIGEPFSPSTPPQLKNDPIDSLVEVKAIAGPMTKDQAIEFRRKWKTPPRLTPNKLDQSANNSILNSPANLSMRLQDIDKGLERLGRELASEYHVDWKEHWPFLNDFVDLRTTDGLNKLEDYLKNKICKSTELMDKELLLIFNYETNSESLKYHSNNNSSKLNNSIDALCEGFELLMHNSELNEESEDESFTTPTGSESDLMELADDTMNIEIFLEGSSPGKIDYAVFNAIPDLIDANEFPFTYRWRHEMQLVIKNKSTNLGSLWSTSPRKRLLKKKLFDSD